jgi:uncharacterized membrane protein SirB2
MLQHFAVWLAATPVSVFIQNVLWIIPAVQTVHILAIAVVMSSVAMIDLRIFGLASRTDTVAQTADRYLPWIWTALVVLAITGVTLITGEPVRSLTNPAFQLKMVLLLVAIIVTIAFQATVRRNVRFWDLSPRSAPAARVMALATLFLWFAIAIAGRWIAYMILDYAG